MDKLGPLAYELFVNHSAGNQLLKILKANYVDVVFSSFISDNVVSTDKVMFKLGQRDIIQRIEAAIAAYEFSIKQKENTDAGS